MRVVTTVAEPSPLCLDTRLDVAYIYNVGFKGNSVVASKAVRLETNVCAFKRRLRVSSFGRACLVVDHAPWHGKNRAVFKIVSWQSTLFRPPPRATSTTPECSDIWNSGLTSLTAGTFEGLTTVTKLYLHDNALTTLPEGIFDDPSALEIM